VATYSGWALTDPDRVLAQLAERGILPTFGDRVVCDHITYAYPGHDAPPMAVARVVGVAADDRVQALVVDIDGTLMRPDGRVYHITYSLAPGAVPSESNDLLELGQWTAVPLFRVEVDPFLRVARAIAEAIRTFHP
jgi:hypothetical protein